MSSYPNSIILNLNSDRIVNKRSLGTPADCQSKELYCFTVENSESVFQIIDGQHRLAGFNDSNSTEFDVVVSFFIDLQIEDQAYLFSIINLKQTKVSKSHVYDLFDLSEIRSPQKTAHTIAKTMNRDPDSPFFQRLKLLGMTPKFEGEALYEAPLTQGMFVDRLLRLISHTPIEDRDASKNREPLRLSGHEVGGGLIFRQFYAEDKDWAILKTMNNYFVAVSAHFPKEWADRSSPLSRTIGYGALLRLLVDLYQEGVTEKDISSDFFSRKIRAIRERYEASETTINFDSFPAAGSGETKLYKFLRTLLE
ncbi:MAG: DGQHR domain-containing protein [Alphaproteobacteria bacterium]|nr:DGQHR domain-containing protein [Alphaproteobacteria bacterium]